MEPVKAQPPAMDKIVDQAARALLEATPQGSEVILFGSYARGNAGPHSDADFLVVEPIVSDAWGESVRLRRHVADVPLAIDIIVVDRQLFEAWKGQVNSIVSRAHREGKRYARTA
jgi:predicted nucleotidyltransferase